MNRDKIIAGGDFMDFETERKIAAAAGTAKLYEKGQRLLPQKRYDERL